MQDAGKTLLKDTQRYTEKLVHPHFFSVSVAFFSLLAAGCEDTSYQKKTAQVTGIVTIEGKPLTFGAISFSPVTTGKESAKSAEGSVGEDGKFSLSTYVVGDGAVVGKHRVTLGSPDPKKRLPGEIPKDYELEVKPGSNHFEIVLLPRPR